MDDLITRLEGAEEGSQALDLAVFEIAQPKTFHRHYWNARSCLSRDMPDDQKDAEARANMRPPAYTGSIDVALTLVPKGWQTTHAAQKWNDPKRWHWGIGCDALHKDAEPTPGGDVCGEAVGPALALCIAALKARRQAA